MRIRDWHPSWINIGTDREPKVLFIYIIRVAKSIFQQTATSESGSSMAAVSSLCGSPLCSEIKQRRRTSPVAP
jgi:hypothetical protein